MTLLERIQAREAGVAVTRAATAEQPDRDGTAEVATPPGQPIQPLATRKPAWLVRARQQPHGLARELDRSHA